MCGINGFICKRKIENGEYRINSMNNSLIHRGPDAEGYVKIDGGYMGQRRLSIIDMDSRSNQPMWTNEKDAAIVYNGEIYNYKELKDSLCYKMGSKILMACLRLLLLTLGKIKLYYAGTDWASNLYIIIWIKKS